MDGTTVLDLLKRNEAELRSVGIDRLAIFGSMARGDATDASDVDIVLQLHHKERGSAYFGQIDTLKERLEALLGRSVNIVVEPVSTERLRDNIERDRLIAFE